MSFVQKYEYQRGTVSTNRLAADRKSETAQASSLERSEQGIKVRLCSKRARACVRTSGCCRHHVHSLTPTCMQQHYFLLSCGFDTAGGAFSQSAGDVTAELKFPQGAFEISTNRMIRAG